GVQLNYEESKPREVSARARETGDEARRDRVVAADKYDRRRGRGAFRRVCSKVAAACGDQIDLAADSCPSRPFYAGRRMSVLGEKAVVQGHHCTARRRAGARCRGQSGEDRDCALPCPGCSIPTTKRCQRAAPSGRTIMLTRRKFIGTTLVAGA